MGSHCPHALIKPRASTVNQVFKEHLPFSTGSSVMSLHYRFVFVLTITFLWGLVVLHFCYQDSLAQNTCWNNKPFHGARGPAHLLTNISVLLVSECYVFETCRAVSVIVFRKLRCTSAASLFFSQLYAMHSRTDVIKDNKLPFRLMSMRQAVYGQHHVAVTQDWQINLGRRVAGQLYI